MSFIIDFQESYKRLDCLCKDLFSSKEGVSEYIRQMECTPWIDRRYDPRWEDDYKQLKHIRWVRNQLAHEVGTLDDGTCTIDDLNYVQDFYQRILDRTDPFSLIRKVKIRIAEERKAQPITPTVQDQKKPISQRTSLSKKIITLLKKLFKK